jgi:hypothetical protein
MTFAGQIHDMLLNLNDKKYVRVFPCKRRVCWEWIRKCSYDSNYVITLSTNDCVVEFGISLCRT